MLRQFFRLDLIAREVYVGSACKGCREPIGGAGDIVCTVKRMYLDDEIICLRCYRVSACLFDPFQMVDKESLISSRLVGEGVRE